MLFSVIVPVYNVEKFLRECVDSVLSQTLKDFELILVNDGSVDDSGAICDEYAKIDTRVKVIHQQNAGQAVARNAGTSVAKGKYIIYIDSDDYVCDKDFLSKLSEKTKSETDVILYGYKKFFEKNKTFGKDICIYPKVKGQSKGKVLELLLESDMYDGCPWNKAVRRDFLVENQIAFIPGMISEDTDWYLQVVTKAETFDSVNQAFIVYRQREGSTSHAPKVKSLTDNINILETWNKRFLEICDLKELKKSYNSILAKYFANDLILYTRFPKKEVKIYYKRLKALKFLLKYSKTSRAKTVNKFCSIFGLRLTILFLKILGKVRG